MSDAFVAVLKPAAAHLWSKEHRVKYSGDGHEYTLVTSSECKGILGTDGRNYALDHIRTTPVDVNFVDPTYVSDADRATYLQGRLNPAEVYCVLQAEQQGQPTDEHEATAVATWRPRHRLHVLRRELLRAYRDTLRVGNADVAVASDGSVTLPAASSDARADAADSSNAADGNSDVDGGAGDVTFNLDVFTNADVVDADDRVAADKHDVAVVSAFLSQTVVPNFVGLLTKREAIPIDGEALTNMMYVATSPLYVRCSMILTPGGCLSP